jgi:hypothetical protein
MGMLRAEHAKRSGEGPAAAEAPRQPAAEARAGIDAAIVEELLRISADNDVAVDWLMLRAVKLYVEEYRKTGRL